jgi:drug/metabolite transporter (DMT)-like permease
VGIGISNFLVSLLDSHTFATSVLQFPGFLIVSIFFKLNQLRRHPLTRSKLCEVFFGHLYDKQTGLPKIRMILHLILRSACFFGLIWLLIISSHYATLAEINFGIITACMSISIPLNCITSYIFWKEKLTNHMKIGVVIILVGVISIGLAKGSHNH